MSEKGDELERKVSLLYHSNSIAVLVSPKFLRSRGCGQIDLVRIKDDRLEVLEVKSRNNISPTQINRLRMSTHLLGLILNRNSQLSFLINK